MGLWALRGISPHVRVLWSPCVLGRKLWLYSRLRGKKAERKLLKTLKKGKKAVLKQKFTLTDYEGNVEVKKVKVVLKPKPKKKSKGKKSKG